MDRDGTVMPSRPVPSGNEASNDSPFRRLYDAGYRSIVPAIPPEALLSPRTRVPAASMGKVPGMRRPDGTWVGLNFNDTRVEGWISEARAVEWDAWGANVSIPTSFGVVAWDIDVTDESCAKFVEGIIHKSLGAAPLRWGKYPKSMLVYRGRDLKSFDLRFTLDGTPHMIQFLGAGKQFIAYGRHPGGMDYTWRKDLWETPFDALVEIDIDQVGAARGALVEALEMYGAEDFTAGAASGAGGNGAEQESLKGDPDLITAAVAALPNTSALYETRSDWIEVGEAIKAASQDWSDTGRELWLEWCGRWDGGVNDPDMALADWSRMSGPWRIGARWLIEQAVVHGGFDASTWAQMVFDPLDVEETPEEQTPEQKRQGALDAVSARYAFMPYLSRVVKLPEVAGGELHFLRVPDFKMMMNNEMVLAPTGRKAQPWKEVPLGNEWMGSGARSDADKIDFLPGEPQRALVDGNVVINTWRGWPVAPAESNEGAPGWIHKGLALLREHIVENICSGDDLGGDYILWWLGQMLVEPMTKPGTAIALRSDRTGTGKSMLIERVMRPLLGRAAYHCTSSEVISGQFNAPIAGRLFVLFDEVVWPKDHRVSARIKNWVTGRTIDVNEKGLPMIQMHNYGRYMLCTNMERTLPAVVQDRRFLSWEVNARWAKRPDIWEQIFRVTDSGKGRTHLMRWLMNYGASMTVDQSRERKPDSPDLLHQIVLNDHPAVQWIADSLEEGHLIGLGGTFADLGSSAADAVHDADEIWPEGVRFSSTEIYDAVIRHAHKASRFSGDIDRGHTLRKINAVMGAAITKIRPAGSGTRPRHYVFGKHALCVVAFKQYLNGSH